MIDAETRARLAAFLGRACGGAVTVRGVRRLGGGAIQRNWLIDAVIDGGPEADGEQRY